MWKFLGGFITGCITTIIILYIISVSNTETNNDNVKLFEEPKIYSIGCNEFEIFQTNYPLSLGRVSYFINGKYGNTIAIYNNGEHYNDMEIDIEKNDTVWHIGNYTYTTVNGTINVVPIIEYQ